MADLRNLLSVEKRIENLNKRLEVFKAFNPIMYSSAWYEMKEAEEQLQRLRDKLIKREIDKLDQETTKCIKPTQKVFEIKCFFYTIRGREN